MTRRTTSPRCKTQRCKKRAELYGWCISHAEQMADRRFSRWIRDRDGKCTAAGVLDGECRGILQAAHIVGRRNHSCRYSPENVHALCAAHHYTVDQHGQEGAKWDWAMEVLGIERYEILMTAARFTPTKRRAAIEAYLALHPQEEE